MQIDSVRELKTMCLKQHVEPLTARPRNFSVLALGARTVKLVDPTQRTIALGIARKSERDFQLAVRIQSRALEDSPYIKSILERAKGEAEVRYIGRLVKRTTPWNQTRQRPLLVGISIGHFRITAGTLGCFVKQRKGGAVRILSNNHVLADENAGKKGDTIIQPGAYDGGSRANDTIGRLDKFVRLRKDDINFVDAAIGSVDKAIQYDYKTLKGVGALNGVATSVLDVGNDVSKVGRTTDATRGRVTAIELDNVVVGYDIGNLRFDNQIEIEGAGDGPFSQGGDSGSLIVNAQREAVALLFAGGDQGGSNGKGLTFGNPVQAVFDALGVDLLY